MQHATSSKRGRVMHSPSTPAHIYTQTSTRPIPVPVPVPAPSPARDYLTSPRRNTPHRNAAQRNGPRRPAVRRGRTGVLLGPLPASPPGNTGRRLSSAQVRVAVAVAVAVLRSGGGGDGGGIPSIGEIRLDLRWWWGARGFGGVCVDGKSISEEPCLCRRVVECGGAWHGGFSRVW
jgi:hypothetical protein